MKKLSPADTFLRLMVWVVSGYLAGAALAGLLWVVFRG